MGSPRIAGNRKPVLTLGTPGTDISVDLISYSVENEEADSDVVTFEDAASGGARQWFLRVTAIQSTATNSFWTNVWENTGESDIPYTIAPHGNAVATVDQPHFVGTLTYGPKPNFGGEASTSASSAFTFDYEFKIDGDPTRDTGV